MKKTFLIAAAGLAIIPLAASAVYAATPDDSSFCGFGRGLTLTDSQRQEMAPLFEKRTDLQKQMLELHREMLQKQVEFGNLTQAEADQRLERMQSHRGHMGAGGRGGMMPGAAGGCPAVTN